MRDPSPGRAPHPPGRRAEIAGEDAEQSGLAGPVRAGDELPGPPEDLKRDRLGQSPVDGDVSGADESRSRSDAEVGEPERLRRFGHGHGVGLEGGPPTVDVGDESAGASGTLVFARPLVRPPARDEPILRGAEIVLELRPLLLLAGVLLLPALPFGPAAGAVSGVAAAVDAGAPIRCRVEIDRRLRDVCQQRAVVTDDDDSAGACSQPLGHVVQSRPIEVIGRFVEQQEIGVAAEEAGQSDPIPMTDGHLRERS